MIYRGRFAPSPTGPLHFGSLVAALGSFLDARHHDGEWLLRMEDLDPPREMPGAASAILKTLELLGLEWEGPVVYQSERAQRYQDALDHLQAAGLCYPCACSRREIRAAALPGRSGAKGGPVYPGTCRAGLPPGRRSNVLRVRTPPDTVTFRDRLQGRLSQRLERDCGDFVVRRRDGYFAYQLAVVVDDYEQGISHVVRGVDLLDSTPRQIYLQGLLHYPQPAYMHLPLAVNARGDKLGKQTQAAPVDAAQAERALFKALQFLRQEPPPGLGKEGKEDILGWAKQHWNPAALEGVDKIQI